MSLDWLVMGLVLSILSSSDSLVSMLPTTYYSHYHLVTHHINVNKPDLTRTFYLDVLVPFQNIWIASWSSNTTIGQRCFWIGFVTDFYTPTSIIESSIILLIAGSHELDVLLLRWWLRIPSATTTSAGLASPFSLVTLLPADISQAFAARRIPTGEAATTKFVESQN